jgi:hypothetical protein
MTASVGTLDQDHNKEKDNRSLREKKRDIGPGLDGLDGVTTQCVDEDDGGGIDDCVSGS